MAQPPDKPRLPSGPMALHACLAAAFFFAFNRFALAQPLDTSLMWGAVAAPCAAYVAYTQTRR